MKLFLIRHGETTGDIEDRYGGDYDDHLTSKGKEQSKELSCKLRTKGVELIYHSPRIRATETARIVSKELSTELRAINDLRERNNYGILTGLIKSKAKKQFPVEVQKLLKSKLNHKVTDSESYPLFKKRVINAFTKLVNKNEFKTIAIISHGGPISCIIREILKLGESRLGDCAILEIEKDENGLRLINMDNASLQ